VSSLGAKVTAVLFAAVLVSCSSRGQDTAARSTQNSDAPVVTGEPADDNATDVMFADTMIAQDQQGIDMSALIPSHVADSNFIAVAAKIASERRSDIAILTVLRVQWSADRKSPGSQQNVVTTRGMLDPSAIAKLESTHGSAFETLWLQSIVGLDTASIDTANAEIASGKNVDAVRLAKQIVDARRAEITQMKKPSGT